MFSLTNNSIDQFLRSRLPVHNSDQVSGGLFGEAEDVPGNCLFQILRLVSQQGYAPVAAQTWGGGSSNRFRADFRQNKWKNNNIRIRIVADLSNLLASLLINEKAPFLTRARNEVEDFRRLRWSSPKAEWDRTDGRPLLLPSLLPSGRVAEDVMEISSNILNRYLGSI